MNTENLINDYFEKSLSPEDQIQFDLLMQSDADFAQEVHFQKNLKKAIALEERATLKAKLQSFETATELPKSKVKPIRVWYAAASIILICGLGIYFTQNSTTSIYNKYYQTYPNVVAPTVRGENSANIQSEAFFEYDNGNYQKAEELFTRIYNSEKVDYALFYKALALLELDKTSDAITTFKLFDLTKNNSFTPFVKWYLALAYLKENQKENAILLLQSLSDIENPQQEMAKKLLTELE
jgi:tetratricopeptide (TPR) repeat protein